MALFTLLLSIPPIILLGLSFRPPRKLSQRAKQVSSVDELSHLLKEIRRQTCCRVACGLLFFIMISLFCCTYLIAFSQVANPAMNRDWLVSTSISIMLDLVVFEMVTSISVGFLGLIYFGCKLQCVICLLVLIEVYRFIRNFVDT